MKYLVLFYLCLTTLTGFCTPSASALVLLGKDTDANQTDAGTQAPFAEVGHFTSGGASAVHLGQGWMLTAAHAGIGTEFSFNGVETYNRDTSFTPVQVAADVDLKIFKLTETPEGLTGVALYTGTQELNSGITLIGYGVGRDPSDTDMGPSAGDVSVTWGDDSTIAKRWGTNTVSQILPQAELSGYIYDALVWELNNSPTQSADEAGLTRLDSGSATFIEQDGQWYLAGINTGVSTAGTSVFSTIPQNADINIAVRISSYHSQITAITVPEPVQITPLCLAALLLLWRPRLTTRRQ